MTHKTHGGETSIHLAYTDRRLICVDSNDQEHRPNSEKLAIGPHHMVRGSYFLHELFFSAQFPRRKSEQGGLERQYQNEGIDENNMVVETDVRGREN